MLNPQKQSCDPAASETDAPLVLHTRVVSGTGGGPEKTILNSPRFLQSLGYRSICAYMRPPGDRGFDTLRSKASDLAAPLLEIDDRGAWDLRVCSAMLKVCRQQKVAIWHGHDYKSNALGLLLRRFWPMKLVTTVHGWVKHTKKTPLYYGIDRYCLRHYQRVICVSEDLHRRCLEIGVPPDRCETIENAIDLDAYPHDFSREQAKKRLGIDPARIVIGGVGRLSAEKGFHHLIGAATDLLQQGHRLDLLIAGEGDAQTVLQQQIDHSGYGDQIRLLGFQDDPAAIYQAMDIFVLSSIREGLPNVVLEAMACKVPVLATRIAGVPRLITSEENGLLVAPDSQQELTASLARLIQEQALRLRLAEAGYQTIATNYSFPQRMKRMAALYDSLLK